jgi:hypothetical protein
MTVFRSGLTQFRSSFAGPNVSGRPDTMRPGATLAEDIVAAYRKAIGEEDDPDDPDNKRRPKDDDGDQPQDDDSGLRGPPQQRIVATAEGILAALAKADGRRR